MPKSAKSPNPRYMIRTGVVDSDVYDLAIEPVQWGNDPEAAATWIPEQRLWRAVLAEAIHVMLGRRVGRNHATDMRKGEAAMWIQSHTTEVGSFLWVCDVTGLDAERLRAQLYTVLQAGRNLPGCRAPRRRASSTL